MKIWKKITYSKSFWDFLREKAQQNVVARMLVAYNKYTEHNHHAYTLMVTYKDADYITMRPNGMLSFLPAGKEHIVKEDGQWAREGRQEGKPAKVIRKLFTEKALRVIKPKDFEAFSNQYKARFLDNGFSWELRDNKAIPDVYDMMRAEGGGKLNDSCMNGDADTCDIYKNCKDLRILLLLNSNGELCGRALVWALTHKGESITFMDRIYTSENYMEDMFLEYALENGWWRKVNYTSYDYKTKWMSPEGEVHSMLITIDTPTDFRSFPYIDTFSFGGDGYLNNCQDGPYTYDDTGGGRSGDDEQGGVEDEYAGGRIDEEYAITLSDHSSRSCHRGIITHSENCVEAIVSGHRNSRRWEWFLTSDGNVTEINDTWYYVGHENVVGLHDGGYELMDETIYCETNGDHYRYDDYSDYNIVQCESDGSYYKESDPNVVQIGNVWHLRHDDNVIQLHDGEWVLVNEEDLVEVMGLWYRKTDEAIVYSGYTQQFHLATDESIVKVGGIWYPKEGDPDRHRTGNKFVDAHIIQQLHGKWYFKNDDRLVMIQGKFYHKRKDRKILSHIAGFWRLRGTMKFALTDKQKYGAEALQYITTKREAQIA